MHTRRQFGTRLAAFSAALATRALPAFAADTTLRFGSISVAGSPTYTKVLEPYARSIERVSQGQLEIALKPAGGYGKVTELVPMVEKGDIDMAYSVQGYQPGRYPQTTVIELPMLFTDSGAGTKALNALYKEGLLAKDYTSFKVLALFIVPPFRLFTTGRKVSTARDLRGLRVRAPSLTVGMAMARLGAIPLGIPAAGIGDAIANGTVDAIMYSMDATLGTRGAGDRMLREQLSVAVDMPFAAPAQMIVMHQAKWDALSPNLQAALEQATAAFLVDSVRVREQAEIEAAKQFQVDPHYTFVPYTQQFHDELQQALAPSYEDWKADMAKRGLDGERLLNRTRELVRQFTVAAN